MSDLAESPVEPPTEPTLDPHDWEELRHQGRELWSDLVDWLATIRERPAWRSVPDDVRARLLTPVPLEPQGLPAALADVRRDVLPYPYGNVHPRFWGWVNGSALPAGILADLVASTMNPNVGAFDHAAVFVEEQVLAWLRQMLGFSGEGDGLLTSGGSMANLLGLAAARSAGAGFDVRKRGLANAPRFTVYGSLETHSSITKAIELLGIGSDQLRRLPVDEHYRVDLDALARTIADDRANGFHPLAVIGNAGTVNTGATDDLDGLADLCEREGLWMHVDGAFGAMAWLCPEERPALRGLQRADSVAFDLHKWMYLSNDVGCVFVRDPEALKRAFAFTSPYLTNTNGGLAAYSEGAFKDRGIELTRRFRALKAWVALKEHGLKRFEEMVRQNLRQARYLAEKVESSPSLELLAPVPLNVVCFRFFTPVLSFEELNDLNRELLVRLQEAGTAVPSHTVLGGAYTLRVAVTNHRSTFADFDLLTDEVVRLGERLLEEQRSTTTTHLPTSAAPCAAS